MNRSHRQEAEFATTSRLLACLLNEGLIGATIEKNADRENGSWILLQGLKDSQDQTAHLRIRVALRHDARLSWTGSLPTSFVEPTDLAPPVLVKYNGIENGREDSEERVELHPGKLFVTIATFWLDDELIEPKIRTEMTDELTNCTENQEEWFHYASKQPEPELTDPSIRWERAIIRGHPTHPLHRSCVALTPLEPYRPSQLASLLEPEIRFLSVPTADIRLVGPYQATLSPLLEKLGISEPEEGHVVSPCLARQIPAIQETFPRAKFLPTHITGAAQAAMRTVQLSPALNFPYDVKFALNCRITSAIRTVTPWTACAGPEISELLAKLLSPELWPFREIAAVTGGQQDFEKAKLITCLLREDLEPRAREQGQAFIVAAALAESGVDTGVSHAERVFKLDTVEKRKTWFRSYAAILLRLLLEPLLRHGIGLEAHGQNVVVRVDIKTHKIAGFAVRDIGGIEFYMPTLQEQGYDLKTLLPNNVFESESLVKQWQRTHHAIFRLHLHQLLRALRLQHDGGWEIVREELSKFISHEGSKLAREMEAYFLRKTIPYKCFMRMRIAGIYRTYIWRDVPNVLLD